MSFRGHETVDHTADMGVRGWGRTPAEAFEEAAAAMIELGVNATGISSSREIRFSRTADDLKGLLLEFLNGLIAEADLSRTMVIGVRVLRLERRDGNWIVEAVADVVPFAAVKDRLLVEVKAATYYGASVQEGKPGVWVAQCVVDL